jgi:biotin operon repressor
MAGAYTSDEDVARSLERLRQEVNSKIEEAVSRGMKVEASIFELHDVKRQDPTPKLQIRVLKPVK